MTHTLSDEYLVFKGKIFVCDIDSISKCITIFDNQTVLGFDTESKPSFKKGIQSKISIIQLADDKNALIFRIQHYRIHTELIALFENKNIIKVGSGIKQDLKQLQQVCTFNPQSFVDLQDLLKQKGYEVMGLKKMTELFLNKKLSKRQQLSNWNKPQLTEAQIRYAATDAYATYLLYQKLNNE